MKVRTGFVSNSSSSSFCIYGVSLEESDFDLPEEKNEEDAECSDDEEFWEKLEARASKMGLEFIRNWECESIYLGRSYSTIKNNETGKEFKDDTSKKVQKFLGKKMKCETIEETISC